MQEGICIGLWSSRSQVLWIDDTKLEIMAKRYVWCKKGKTYDKRNTIPTVKHGGGSVL